MAENSKIEWCDSTFNPWIGCTNVGPGCDHCYAEALMDKRWRRVKWGIGKPRERTSAANWKQPLLWEKEHDAFALMHGRRRRVFCASLADVFDNQAPAAWRAELFALIGLTPHLDWLLLTKRIGNVKQMLEQPGMPKDGMPANVWLGATVVNQEEADRDIPKLLAVPARVRFLSIEPMLGPICIERATDQADEGTIDWVIAGGESGPSARPVHPDWLRALRDECEAFGVPFIFKQFGEWRPPMEGEKFNTAMGRAQKVPAFIVAPEGTVHCFENERTASGGKVMLRVGKKLAGRRLDGLTHDGFPV